MSELGLFVVIDGVDYAGKSSVLEHINIPDTLAISQTKKYDGIPKSMGDKSQYNKHSTLPRDRFDFYMQTNRSFSSQIRKDLVENNVVLVRYALSTIAFHNKMIQAAIGNNPLLENEINDGELLTPDITFLICSSKYDLEQRMKLNPPEHMHESDINYLMNVQDEFLRLTEGNRNDSLYGNLVIVENEQNRLEETIEFINSFISHYTR